MRCISIALNTHTYKTQLMLSARAARAVGAVASVFNIEESVKHFGFNRVIEFQVLLKYALHISCSMVVLV